ncbi:hypothetical protein GCM10010219_63610 [Streptomyces netropsis]|nr:hypothetical protein GCM10010219_63610 [Streptomyces netropsis]
MWPLSGPRTVSRICIAVNGPFLPGVPGRVPHFPHHARARRHVQVTTFARGLPLPPRRFRAVSILAPATDDAPGESQFVILNDDPKVRKREVANAGWRSRTAPCSLRVRYGFAKARSPPLTVIRTCPGPPHGGRGGTRAATICPERASFPRAPLKETRQRSVRRHYSGRMAGQRPPQAWITIRERMTCGR